MAHYVYGIIQSDASPPTGKGIGGARLRVIAGEDAAALVSAIDSDEVRLGRDALLIHSRVLEKAMKRGTVLPMRFGVVMADEDEVRSRLLDGHAEELREQLAEFADKVEVRIRATYDEQSLLHEVVGENPEIASLRDSVRGRPDDATYYEQIRLGELVAGAVERHRARDAEMIVDALASAALAVEVGDVAHERVVVQASFLVERAALAQFDRTVDEIAASYGGAIRFKYTGPLPPHSFVQFAERV